MNEENSAFTEQSQQNQNEWQAPPLPEEIVKTDEPPQMSEVATLGNIFVAPGETFEDLRRKPRFVLAGLLIIVAASLFQILFIQKVGFERLIRERIESSPRVQQLPADQREKIIEQQTQPFVKYISYASAPILLIIVFLLGGLIYWLGANVMGGTTTFSRGISVWIYSSLPPTIVFVLANLLVLMLKSVDDIDITNSQSGLIHANPTFFFDGKTMPALAALLSAFDLFAIWGWILAAIGLQKVAKISAGAAWAIVLILALAGVAAKVAAAFIF